MRSLTRKNKSELFKALVKEENSFGTKGDSEKILEFSNDIWDLRAMPSEDNRFTNAYDDIHKHIVMNDDYELEYLFLDRLKLLDDESNFVKFIENVVSPKHRENEDDIVKYVLLVNSYIEKENVILAVSSYDDDGLPIYRIQEKQSIDSPIDIPPNKIVFNVVKVATRYSGDLNYHTPPQTKPSFILVYNTWDDFTFGTTFSLFYYGADANSEGVYLGETKITDGENNNTAEHLPDSFTILKSNFCSLGQSDNFYFKLKGVVGRDLESVLYALKDCAFFPDIHENFERNKVFNTSLIRDDDAEQLLRVAKHKIYGFDLDNLYNFKYNFQPKYSREAVEIHFDFDSIASLPNRIYAIIGKNGTGKTQLITSLPLNISQKKNDHFVPRVPLFSKVIAVSYSLFDNFEIPKKTSSFNYVYCGLLNDNKELRTPRQQVMRFHSTWKKIEILERMYQWRDVLLNFIDEETVNTFIVEEEGGNLDTKLTVDVKGFNKVKDQLSSGQHIILYIISEIVSNIRLDSLLLFDEPETHLHPNAISQLMNTIYKLVHEFKSYCILATHSPILIQELLSRNVLIIERHESIPSVRNIGIESFGENLTTLTEEVFGNKEIVSQYKIIIDKLVEEGKEYDKIVSDLEFRGTPLSLNAKLYIKSQTQ